MLNLNASILASLPVPIPSLRVQRRIVELLSVLDDRIDLVVSTSETLESIAGTIFRSWFIDFDPIRAKAAGLKPEGMDEETASLFPSEFEESELGLIPKGWREGCFGDAARLVRQSVNPSRTPEVQFEHYSIPAYDSGQVPIVEYGANIKSNKTAVHEGTVLQSKLNPHIRRIWLPGEVGENAICSTEFLVWHPNPEIPRSFLYCLLSSKSFIELVNGLATGTSNSHQRVRAEQVAKLPVVLPSVQILSAYKRVAKPLLSKVEHNRKLIQTLSALRDTLLPRLISGKLRIPEAEEVVKEAVS